MSTTNPILMNISGPYGVGKDTMLNHLLAVYKGRVVRVSTITTRPPTPESDPSYRFASDTEFEDAVSKGQWMVNRQLKGRTAYGTSVDEIEHNAQKGKISLHSIFPSIAGAGQMRTIFGSRLVSVALLPAVGDVDAQLAELKVRMLNRGREDVSAVTARLATQREQIEYILHNAEVDTKDGEMKVFDRIIVNDVLESCQAEISRYFHERFLLP